MSKIVVPFDGSESALRALRYAMKAADEIHLVNVQTAIDAPAVSLHMTREAIDNMQLDQSRRVLAPACKVLDDAAFRYQAHALIGHAGTAIARLAETENADSIVMGTRGMSALGKLMFGSVVTQVVQQTKLPVTLIK
jgi:nucleotide-binding universal stress UspA family protein